MDTNTTTNNIINIEFATTTTNVESSTAMETAVRVGRFACGRHSTARRNTKYSTFLVN